MADMKITGTAATVNEQDLHIHISSVEGKSAFQAAQWMAPKAVLTRHSMGKE
jgi:hypothetical protein